MHNKLSNIRSNDGRFHNGNPATGSLGTIVDDVWLNNVQDSLQDFFDELNNVLALVSVQANPAKKTQVAEAIATLIGNVRRIADSNTRSLQNVIYNSKKSNAINSLSSDTVATSYAVKTLNDKIKYIYNVVKSNNIPVNLDLTSREQIIAEMGNNYQGVGVYRFTFHNITGHNITGLPLGDIKGAVAIELEVMGGFSRMSCQYLYANRQFMTHVDWNKPTLTLRWYEVLSQDGEGKVPRPITVNGAIDTNHRVMVRRNSRTGSPYLLLLDDSVDLGGEVAARKLIGGIQFHAGKQGTTEGLLKGALRVNILTDKNAEIEFTGRSANETWVRFLTMLTATGNVIVGHSADNGRDRLQINGTARATAPATNANNDQLPTTAWVNSALAPKVDKLVQQTLDLKNLRQDKWYPVILKLPNMRQLNYFEIRTTLGDGNKPTWANHAGGISLFCQWDTQHAGWGTYDIDVGMRDVKKFEYRHCNQSPMLKIGQLFQPGYEYFYLRGGASYTLYREAGVAVEIATSPNGYHWQNEDGQYRQHLPLIESYDESLVPMTTKQELSTVSRRDYSRRINGTAAGQTHNQMDVVGSVHIHPDGRIVQILHLKHFRDFWFELEDASVGYGEGIRGIQVNLQLWTAMPNKILSVQPQLIRATHPTSSVVYGQGEAAEHICAWDLRKQGNSRDRVIIDMSRFRGSASEHIDMYVVVEGY